MNWRSEVDAGWRSWPVTASIALSLGGAAMALEGVLMGLSWLLPLWVSLAVSAAALVLTRWLSRSTWLPYLTAMLALGLSLNISFLSDRALLGVLPTPGVWGGAFELLGQARTTILYEYVPAPPNPGIVYLATITFSLLLLLGDWIAVRAASPASVGILLVSAFIVPALLKFTSVGLWPFAVAAGGYILLLAAGRRWQLRKEAGLRGGTTTNSGYRRALTMALATLLLAVGIPMTIPGFNDGMFPQGSRLASFGKANGLNPLLTLNQNLRQQGGTAFTLSSTAETAPYVRLTTVDDFGTDRWGPSERKDSLRLDLKRLDSDVPASTKLDRQLVYSSFKTGSFSSPYLPLPEGPLNVSGLGGQWGYDPENMAVQSTDSGTSANSDYRVYSTAPRLSAEVLRQAGPPSSVSPRFTQLPGNVPEEVAETAARVTQGSFSAYDRALKLQEYFRGPEFTYSLTAPAERGYDGTGMNVLAQFLREKSGYCTHYASAMSVMARAVGIPSRVAVGFAPGEASGRSTVIDPELDIRSYEYLMRGEDAHAWPELYFEGIGWVRFEPTPSRGFVPGYAMDFAGGGSAEDPENPRDERGTDAPSVAPLVPTPTPTPTQSSPAALGRDSSTAQSLDPVAVLGLGGGVGLVILLLLSPMALRSWRRRRNLNPEQNMVALGLGAMDEVLDTAYDFGFRPAAADTIRTIEQALRSEISAEAQSALAVVVDAYEWARYGQPAGTPGSGHAGEASPTRPPGRSGGALGSETGSGASLAPGSAHASASATAVLDPPAVPAPLREQVATITRSLAGRATRAARLRAAVVPASVFRRRD